MSLYFFKRGFGVAFGVQVYSSEAAGGTCSGVLDRKPAPGGVINNRNLNHINREKDDDALEFGGI